MVAFDSSLLALRYARSLQELAAQDKQEEAVLEALLGFTAALKTSPELRAMLGNPAVPRRIQVDVLTGVMNKLKAGKLAGNFLALLVKNGRLNLLDEIIPAMKSLMAQSRGEIEAEVHSATPLVKDDIKRIEEVLKTSFKSGIRLKSQIVPELLGGIRIKAGSRMFDATIASKLEELQLDLKGRLRGQYV